MQIMRLLYLLCYLICGMLPLAAVETSDDPIPDTTVLIPMRDGTLLPTDIYLPTPDARNLPCILLRSPAGRKEPPWLSFANMAKAGYVIAIQDTRSIIDPEGKTFPFITDGWGKFQDGYDTVEWLAKSPYTNGKIGTWGSSALGITQLLMAPSNPPHLHCQYILVAASSVYHHILFPGGQLLKHQVEEWLIRYAPDTGVLNYVCQRPFYNDFWHQLNTLIMAEHIHVPAIHIGGWYDTFLQGTLTSFVSRQRDGGHGAKGRQKLVIGPWTHLWPLSKKLGDFEVPLIGYTPPFDISPKRWFDHYLKGDPNGVQDLPNVIYYVMGPFDNEPSTGNVWRTSEVWPIPAEKIPFYLTPDFGLQEKKSFEGILDYEYNPLVPTPTVGGRNLFLESGPKDQKEIEDREDVLVFTSIPLQEDLEVTGELAMKLFFSSNQSDTDIVVRLCDVYPDGRSILISDGIYRIGVACHQEFLDLFVQTDEYKPIKIEPDVPVEINIDLWATSLVFAKGHSIRVSISSSNYPRYEKNMNTGIFGSHTGRFNIAQNKIYTGKRYPSQLILPVVRKGEAWLKKSNL